MKEYAWGWKHEKKSQVVCGQSLKTIFEFLKNHHGNTVSKKLFYFKNKFLYFESCNYKTFMKIHHVSRVLFYVLNIQEKHVDKWFFISKVLFLYQLFTKLFQFFLWILIYSTRMDPCVQKIQKIKIHIPF